MLTRATETSIEAFHAHVGSGKASAQRTRILEFIRANRRFHADWSIGEIAAGLRMERSTVSARLNEMLKAGDLVEQPKRADRQTGVRIRPVAINPQQWELFA